MYSFSFNGKVDCDAFVAKVESEYGDSMVCGVLQLKMIQ